MAESNSGNFIHDKLCEVAFAPKVVPSVYWFERFRTLPGGGVVRAEQYWIESRGDRDDLMPDLFWVECTDEHDVGVVSVGLGRPSLLPYAAFDRDGWRVGHAWVRPFDPTDLDRYWADWVERYGGYKRELDVDFLRRRAQFQRVGQRLNRLILDATDQGLHDQDPRWVGFVRANNEYVEAFQGLMERNAHKES